MFDSLDTMLLMGLKDEFDRALKLVEKIDFRMLPVSHVVSHSSFPSPHAFSRTFTSPQYILIPTP